MRDKATTVWVQTALNLTNPTVPSVSAAPTFVVPDNVATAPGLSRIEYTANDNSWRVNRDVAFDDDDDDDGITGSHSNGELQPTVT